MNKNKINTLCEQIEKIAKKMSAFTYRDVEMITEESKENIEKAIKKLVKKNFIKEQNGKYVCIPKGPETERVFYNEDYVKSLEARIDYLNKVLKDQKELDILLQNMTPDTFVPQEIYIKHFKDVDGYCNYFFAPVKTKKYIFKIVKALKETQNLAHWEVIDYCLNNDISIEEIYGGRFALYTYGFNFYITDEKPTEPEEIYTLFKRAYLTPDCLSASEAKVQAVYQFGQKIDYPIYWKNFRHPLAYLRQLLQEYTKDEIRKYRTPNYAEFNLEEIPLGEENC